MGHLGTRGQKLIGSRCLVAFDVMLLLGRLGAAHLPTYLKVVLLAPCSCRRKLVLTLGDDPKKSFLEKRRGR